MIGGFQQGPRVRHAGRITIVRRANGIEHDFLHRCHDVVVKEAVQQTYVQGGAGIGGFYTPTAVGTVVAEGKETRVIDGKEYVLEKPLKADFALVRAWKGDRWGNLVFRKTTRNFSSLMCTAAKCTIVEVEHLVDVGELDPDQIHVPSIYVKRIFQGTNYQKWIERRTVVPRT